MADEQIKEELTLEIDAPTPPDTASEEEHDLKETLKKIKETVSEEDPKPSSQLNLRTILGGDLLTSEMVRSHIWLFVLKDAKFRALSSSSRLTEKCRESHVLERLKQNKDSLLHQADQPPYIIEVPE